MKITDTMLKAFGDKGPPLFIAPDLIPTWDSFDKLERTPRERILSVLGFLHLLSTSGIRQKVPGLAKVNPAQLYASMLSEQLSEEAKWVSTQLRKTGVLNVCQVYKSMVNMHKEPKGYTLSMCIILSPKRNEPMDSALVKLGGLLYRGELPVQLKEHWKKLPVKSQAKAKSALPRYSDFASPMASPTKFLPLVLDTDRVLYAARAKDDLLVLKYVSTKPTDQTPWFSSSKKESLIKETFRKAFLTVKG